MSNLEKAIQKFDKLSEKQRLEIARKMIAGVARYARKAKARALQKA